MKHPLATPTVRCAHCQDFPSIPVWVGVIPTPARRAWPVWACPKCARNVRLLLLGK